MSEENAAPDAAKTPEPPKTMKLRADRPDHVAARTLNVYTSIFKQLTQVRSAENNAEMTAMSLTSLAFGVDSLIQLPDDNLTAEERERHLNLLAEDFQSAAELATAMRLASSILCQTLREVIRVVPEYLLHVAEYHKAIGSPVSDFPPILIANEFAQSVVAQIKTGAPLTEEGLREMLKASGIDAKLEECDGCPTADECPGPSVGIVEQPLNDPALN